EACTLLAMVPCHRWRLPTPTTGERISTCPRRCEERCGIRWQEAGSETVIWALHPHPADRAAGAGRSFSPERNSCFFFAPQFNGRSLERHDAQLENIGMALYGSAVGGLWGSRWTSLSTRIRCPVSSRSPQCAARLRVGGAAFGCARDLSGPQHRRWCPRYRLRT